MNYTKISLAILLLVISNILSWYSLNLQIISKWWENKQVLTVLLFSVPIGLCVVYSHKILYFSLSNSTSWSPKFISGSLSLLTYSIMSWVIVHESPFQTKTLMCLVLASIIMLIQIFWK